MTLLSVQALSKNFGGVKALSQVSFDVLQGDILALIGPNGAGKTTCFNMINGLLSPTSGAIFMEGKELTGLPPYRRAARGLARTFQNIQLFGGMTVLENVLTGMHLSQKAGVVTALLPLPGVLLAEAQNRQRPGNGWISSSWRTRPTGRPKPWPTGSSAAWKSPGPWPRSPNSCSWTNLPRASTPGKRKT